MNEKKDILVNSPRGAGNVFCQHLVARGLRINNKWGGHDVDKFEEGIPNISILRNPYDAIGHSMQTRAGELKETFDQNPEDFINSYIPAMVEDYTVFLDKIKSTNYIKTVTFEFLTQHSDEFLENIGKEFDIDVRPNKFSAEEVLESMRNDPYVSDKAPKEKSEARKLIDSILADSQLMKNLFDKYVEYKATI